MEMNEMLNIIKIMQGSIIEIIIQVLYLLIAGIPVGVSKFFRFISKRFENKDVQNMNLFNAYSKYLLHNVFAIVSVSLLGIIISNFLEAILYKSRNDFDWITVIIIIVFMAIYNIRYNKKYTLLELLKKQTITLHVYFFCCIPLLIFSIAISLFEIKYVWIKGVATGIVFVVAIISSYKLIVADAKEKYNTVRLQLINRNYFSLHSINEIKREKEYLKVIKQDQNTGKFSKREIPYSSIEYIEYFYEEEQLD